MVEIPGHDGEGSSGTARVAMRDSQTAMAGPGFTYDWTQISMDQVVSATNMQRAFHRVRANKGKPGVDGIAVEALGSYLQENWTPLKDQLLAGEYQPQPVRKVEIPKPQGGKRMLGIPTVVDRVITQAILQVLQPYYETQFSDASFGFRPLPLRRLQGHQITCKCAHRLLWSRSIYYERKCPVEKAKGSANKYTEFV